jgi:hypothetical protein
MDRTKKIKQTMGLGHANKGTNTMHVIIKPKAMKRRTLMMNVQTVKRRKLTTQGMSVLKRITMKRKMVSQLSHIVVMVAEEGVVMASPE